MLLQDKAKEFAEQILSAVESANTICLTTHVNPDGDGLCTCLALKRILQYLGYTADFVVDDFNLERYLNVQIIDNAILDNDSLAYDLVIIVDLHDYQRLGSRIHLADKAQKVFILDHHEIDKDLMKCTDCWIDSKAVCTGWMLYVMFKDIIDTMPDADREYVGSCLYTTLLNDTNNFTNANTDENAYELAAAVCRLGVKTYQVYRQFMISRKPMEMRLLGQVLSTIELLENGRVLFMDSSQDMLKQNGLDKDAISNLTRWVQDLKGVDTVVYFREDEIGKYRLSLRSKTINVHAIAIKYGGGGHLQASGCSIEGNLPEIKKLILEEIISSDKMVH